MQLAARPARDQPLIDLAEYAVPALRSLYFTAPSRATFADASEHAERYRREAEQLNDRKSATAPKARRSTTSAWRGFPRS
jgi:hypothetical protein